MDLDFTHPPTRTLEPVITRGKVRPTALYHWRDVTGMPIYTGITNGLFRRQGQHDDGSVWTQFADTCTIDVLPARTDALAAEREAIEAERPIFNVQYNETVEAFDRMVQYLESVGRSDVLDQFEGVSGMCRVRHLGPSLVRGLASLRARRPAPAFGATVDVIDRKTVQVCLGFEGLGGAHPVWLWIYQISLYRWGQLTCAFHPEEEGFGPLLGTKRLIAGGRHEDDFAGRFAAEIERSVVSNVHELIGPEVKARTRRQRRT